MKKNMAPTAGGGTNNKNKPSNKQPKHDTIDGGGFPDFNVRRERTGSAGSTRDVFYQGKNAPKNASHQAPTVNELRNRKKQQQQKKNKESTTTTKKEKISMADMANMAMEGLTSDIAPIPGTEPREKLKPGSRSTSSSNTSHRLSRNERPISKQQKNKSNLHTIHDHDNSNSSTLDYSDRGASFFFSQFGNSKTEAKHDKKKSDDDLHDSMDNLTRDPSLFGAALLDGGGGGKNNQQDEINMFASLVQADYGATTDNGGNDNNKEGKDKEINGEPDGIRKNDSREEDSYAGMGKSKYYANRIISMIDPTEWLSKGSVYDEDTDEWYYEDQYSLAALIRHFFFNPMQPEFSSLQQFVWACLIGVFMGVYTAVWHWFIEAGVDFFWETVPEFLTDIGLFTDIHGSFPLYHYMWICPAIFGGILSYIFVVLPTKIPDQNTWINAVHSQGVQDHTTFFTLFFLSTVGMWSGLSLGPELPLVLTGGMFGSWLGLLTRQSMLQARVLNLTAASAAVGGFFGFPMAGSLFVLEIPHRMGLQYFEALSPGTIASIIAVLVNRLVTGNEVTGYFRYPFLSATLPSSIFTCAAFYGFYGCIIGIIYTHGCKFFKTAVHDWFHAPHDDHDHHDASNADEKDDDGLTADMGSSEESAPLMAAKKKKLRKAREKVTLINCLKSYFCCVIREEPKRAAVAGTIAGALVGVIGIFVPHIMFWGEAQLQNLIDKGRTPLPVFGEGNEPTAALTYYAMCMIDSEDKEAIQAGFSIGCSALIAVAKTIVIGLSLGTGIIGGHFWGPLFVGCATSHLLTDVVHLFHSRFGFGQVLAAHPCLVILCTMGSAHVVTFRAHMAIMLILTLTISAFNPEAEDSNSPFTVAGDYSAVFPLLVVSVFLSLMASRDTIFYNTQRSRGDITAVPEVLCQPGCEGAPLVVGYDQNDDNFSDDDSYFTSDSDIELAVGASSRSGVTDDNITQNDIEKAFAEASSRKPAIPTPSEDVFASTDSKDGHGRQLSSARLNELLGLTDISQLAQEPTQPVTSSRKKFSHRRTMSAPIGAPQLKPRSRSNSKDWGAPEEPQMPRPSKHERTGSSSSQQGALVRVSSFGNIDNHQPSLLEQARLRSASTVGPEPRHMRVPSGGMSSGPPRHQRTSSMPNAPNDPSRPPHRRVPSSGISSRKSSFSKTDDETGGALSLDDIEQSFNTIINEKVMGSNVFGGSPWTNTTKK